MTAPKAMMPNTLRAASGLWRYRPELRRAWIRAQQAYEGERALSTATASSVTPEASDGYQMPPSVPERASRMDAVKNARPFSEFLTDNFNRQHDYLRISITERCNLRCLYCMPEEGIQLSPPAHLLTTPEIFYLSSLFVSQGVTKIRLTGGEPTVRKDVVPLMQQIGSLRSKGLKELALTTNGISLHRKLDAMVEAGLTGVNLSLDTLDPFQFQIMTRRKGFDAVMRSIDRILEMKRLGANIKLKVNCVVMRGMNEREIVPFVEMGREKDIEVRFIEYMPFGGNKWSKGKMLGYQEMLEIIRSKHPDIHRVQGHKNDTSKTYKVPGFVGRVGFITSMTDDFCGTCNRLRITGDGKLKVCLHGNTEVSLRDMLREGNDGKPIDQEAFEALKELEMGRQQSSMLSDATPLGWGPREHQLLNIIGKAVKRKKEKHAGMGELENMENRPMILIGNAPQFEVKTPEISTSWRQRNGYNPQSSHATPWLRTPTHLLAASPSVSSIRYFSCPARRTEEPPQSQAANSDSGHNVGAETSASVSESPENRLAIRRVPEFAVPRDSPSSSTRNLLHNTSRDPAVNLPISHEVVTNPHPHLTPAQLRQFDVEQAELAARRRELRELRKNMKRQAFELKRQEGKVKGMERSYAEDNRRAKKFQLQESIYGPAGAKKNARRAVENAEATAGLDAWSTESFMDSAEPSNEGRQRASKFGDVQKLALERSLAGLNSQPRTAKIRRQEYYEDVIAPDERVQVGTGTRSAADVAIGKFAAARARTMKRRNPLVRYARVAEPSNGPSTKRGFHSQAQAVESTVEPSWSDSQAFDATRLAEPGSREAIESTERTAVESKAIDAQPIIDSEVFYAAFMDFFKTPPTSNEWLARVSRRRSKRTQAMRLEHARRLEELYNPAFEVWKSLAIRWRQEVWQGVIGLSDNDIELLGQVSISRNKLLQAVENRHERNRAGRPCVRDDPLWAQAVQSRRLLDKNPIQELGVDEQEADLWLFIRTKIKAHAVSSSVLGATSDEIRRVKREAEFADLRFAQRYSSATRRGDYYLNEWQEVSDKIHLELWTFAMGVPQNFEQLRLEVFKDFQLDMDDVRVAMDFYFRQRARRGKRQVAISRSFLQYMRQKLGRPNPVSKARAALLQKRLSALSRADQRTFTSEGDRRMLPTPSADDLLGKPLTRDMTVLPYMPYHSYCLGQKIMVIEKRFRRINSELEQCRAELYHLLTTQSQSSQEAQHVQGPISQRLLRTTVDALSSPGVKDVRHTVLEQKDAEVRRVSAEVLQRRDAPIKNLTRRMTLELRHGETKFYNDRRRMMKVYHVATKYHVAALSLLQDKLNTGLMTEHWSRLYENERCKMVDGLVGAGIARSQLGYWGRNRTWKLDYNKIVVRRRTYGLLNATINPQRARAAARRLAKLQYQILRRARWMRSRERAAEAAKAVMQRTRDADAATLDEQTTPRAPEPFETPYGLSIRRLPPSSRPKADPEGHQDSEASSLPAATLQHLRKHRRRAERVSRIERLRASEVESASKDESPIETSKAAADSNDHDVDDFFELPHEIGMDNPKRPPRATFEASTRLLAPLRRTPDMDDLARPATEATNDGPRLTHLNRSGEAHMVSVAAKPDTKRVAIAIGKVRFSNPGTHELVTSAALKKGDVLATSRIAGIQAAKMCPSIIPLCHPIMISSVKVDITPYKQDDECGIGITGQAECTGPTGVEMEALTAVMGAALTVIDMVKAVDKAASIEDVRVVHKSGGKSGTWNDEAWASQNWR